MKRKEFTGKLSYYESLNCSRNGNPRYYGVFTNESGETLAGKTATDAACAYGFLNYQNAPREVTYHITRNGNIIFDYITVLAGKEIAK
jgi:hypothetical protein